MKVGDTVEARLGIWYDYQIVGATIRKKWWFMYLVEYGVRHTDGGEFLYNARVSKWLPGWRLLKGGAGKG